MTEQDYKGFLMVCANNKQQFEHFGRKVTVTGIVTYGSKFNVQQVFELSCGSTVVFTEKFSLKEALDGSVPPVY